MKYKELTLKKYLEIEELVKSLLKYKPFVKYKDKTLFHFIDNEDEVYIVFSGHDDGALSICFYIGDDGVNTLIDRLAAEKPSPLCYFYNTYLDIEICRKGLLNPGDKNYFIKKGIKIKNVNNIIPHSFNGNYYTYISTTNEARVLIKSLRYLLHLFMTEKKLIDSANENGENITTFVSNRGAKFKSTVNKVLIHEREYFMHEACSEYIDELKDFPKKDIDVHMLLSILPVSFFVDESNISVCPILLTYSFNGRFVQDILTCSPDEVANYSLDSLYEFFKAYGIPKSLTTNCREVYYTIKNTIEALGIEFHLQVFNPGLDEMLSEIIPVATILVDICSEGANDEGFLKDVLKLINNNSFCDKNENFDSLDIGYNSSDDEQEELEKEVISNELVS